VTPPLPHSGQPPILRGVIGVLAAAAVVLLFIVARMPPSGPPPLFERIASHHDQMIPATTWVGGDAEPHLEASIQTTGAVGWLHSELLRFGRDAVSVHRSAGPATWPDNARAVHLDGDAWLFEVADLTMYGWREDGSTVVVASALPANRLRPAALWVRAHPRS
jgi:hypothetical protein